MQSVVSSKEAMDTAFCNAVRVTFNGSTMPAAIMSPNVPLAAS